MISCPDFSIRISGNNIASLSILRVSVSCEISWLGVDYELLPTEKDVLKLGFVYRAK